MADPGRSQPWYVYVLRSKKDGGWYIDSTKNMQKRILSHNAGNRSIIYCEISREKYLKSGLDRRYLKNRLKFFFAV